MNERRTLREHRRRTWLAWTCIIALYACDDFVPPAPAKTAAMPPAMGMDGGDASPGTAPPQDDDGGAAPMTTPARGRAVATLHAVIVPDPREHAVAVVDATTARATHLPCGDTPAHAFATTHADVAVVIDAGGDAACVLRRLDGAWKASNVTVGPSANRVEFSPSTRFAVAFHDRSAEGANDAPRVTQELSVIGLEGQVTANTVVVGLAPRDIAWSTDDTHAFVVSATGISNIDLAASARGDALIAAAWHFGLDLWRSAVVRIASNAPYAIAFEPGANVLHGLDLEDGSRQSVDLSAWAQASAPDGSAGAAAQPVITDALLDAKADNAWVALGGAGALLRVPLPEASESPDRIEPRALPAQATDRLEWVSNGRVVFVSATAPADGRVTLVPVATPDAPIHTVLARAPATVLSAERGRGVGLVHAGEQQPLGYTLLRVHDGLTHFRQTATAPVGVALSSAGDALAAVVAATAGHDAELDVVEVGTLALRRVALTERPRAVGFLSDPHSVFAEVDDPDGRLVFFDRRSGAVRTIAGFLSAQRERE